MRSVVTLKHAAVLALVVLGIYIGVEASKLRILLAIGPGAGFFPLIFAAVLVIASISYLFERPVAPSEVATPAIWGSSRLLVVLAALASVVVLINPLGFRFTSLGLQIVVLVALGMRNIPLILVTAFVGSFGIYSLFDEVLNVRLPIGMFGL